jgi:hypothetical protein
MKMIFSIVGDFLTAALVFGIILFIANKIESKKKNPPKDIK